MPAPLRLVFLGTPHFALVTLKALLSRPDLCTVVGVYTQPDRPTGRGRSLQPAPVKAHALCQHPPLLCLSPTRLRPADSLAAFAALRPDLAVVAAYGNLLPPAWLTTPALGCLNLHASLLPRHRGASPIAHAILGGDPCTGVSLMQMDPGLDTGAVFCREGLPIEPSDTTESLTAKLAALSAATLMAQLPAIAAGTLRAIPQDALPAWDGADLSPSLAPRLAKAQGEIDFGGSACQIARQVRAFYPWPGSFVQNQGARLVVVQAQADLATVSKAPKASETPGTVLQTSPAGLWVACGEGSLLLERVRPAGRGTMSAAAWWSGRRLATGSALVDGLM
jgi:methionyl-tRNA formyltransferase